MYSLGFSASSQQPEALWKKRSQLLLLVMADGDIIWEKLYFVKTAAMLAVPISR